MSSGNATVLLMQANRKLQLSSISPNQLEGNWLQDRDGRRPLRRFVLVFVPIRNRSIGSRNGGDAAGTKGEPLRKSGSGIIILDHHEACNP